MNGKGRIKKIVCPHCNYMLYLHKEIGADLKTIKTWRCYNKVCIQLWPENWFNRFKQFEDHVLRDKDDVDDFNERWDK